MVASGSDAPHLLLLDLHGKLLRLLSDEAEIAFQGLQQAGHHFGRAGKLTGSQRRALAHLDVVSGWVRHISRAKCTAFFQELRGAIAVSPRSAHKVALAPIGGEDGGQMSSVEVSGGGDAEDDAGLDVPALSARLGGTLLPPKRRKRRRGKAAEAVVSSDCEADRAAGSPGSPASRASAISATRDALVDVRVGQGTGQDFLLFSLDGFDDSSTQTELAIPCVDRSCELACSAEQAVDVAFSCTAAELLEKHRQAREVVGHLLLDGEVCVPHSEPAVEIMPGEGPLDEFDFDHLAVAGVRFEALLSGAQELIRHTALSLKRRLTAELYVAAPDGEEHSGQDWSKKGLCALTGKERPGPAVGVGPVKRGKEKKRAFAR